jgi:hypothetical protein
VQGRGLSCRSRKTIEEPQKDHLTGYGNVGLHSGHGEIGPLLPK